MMERKLRNLTKEDFKVEVKAYFPSKGSANTPKHEGRDFHFKDYCPMVFKNIRNMFGIDEIEFLEDICGDSSLRMMNTPGKSGAIFFMSNDMRYIIKTIKKSEVKFLRVILPHYYKVNTLIT